jgi:hypothetical protein
MPLFGLRRPSTVIASTMYPSELYLTLEELSNQLDLMDQLV